MQFTSVSVVALFALAKVASAAEAISQIADGQIQATTAPVAITATPVANVTTTAQGNNTATVTEHTSNGAAKNVVGLGAFAAVAALLL